MLKIDFDKSEGLVPAVIQDFNTHQVLMLGYMNREALSKTTAEGKVTFYSRSKKRLWTKGETSGNFLEVKDIREDCDSDTILIRAVPTGPSCHTGKKSCFDLKIDEPFSGNFLEVLQQQISKRKHEPSPDSYTSKLFAEGINRIAQKVGEEAVEVVIASKNDNLDEFKGEAADLLFHYLVLLQEKETSLQDIIEILKLRHKS